MSDPPGPAMLTTGAVRACAERREVQSMDDANTTPPTKAAVAMTKTRLRFNDICIAGDPAAEVSPPPKGNLLLVVHDLVIRLDDVVLLFPGVRGRAVTTAR